MGWRGWYANGAMWDEWSFDTTELKRELTQGETIFAALFPNGFCTTRIGEVRELTPKEIAEQQERNRPSSSGKER